MVASVAICSSVHWFARQTPGSTRTSRLDRGRIGQHRVQRQRAGLGVAHEHGAVQLRRQIGHGRDVGVRRGQHRIQVGNRLPRQLGRGFDGELLVGERRAEAGTEPELRPDELVGEAPEIGQRAERLHPGADLVVGRDVEARARARDLIRDVHGMALADEVLVPAHAAIRGGVVALAAQGGAVQHDDGDAVVRHRHHVLHVHLVDRDVAAGVGQLTGEERQLGGRLLHRLPAHDEAAATLQRQRRGCGLHVLELLGGAHRR